MKKYEQGLIRMDEDSGLTLDPSVLKEKRQSGRSVTDAGGVNVFSNEFRQKIERYEQVQIQNDQAVWNQIFVEPMHNGTGSTGLAESLFRSPMTEMRAENPTVQADAPKLLQGGILTAMCIGFAVFLYQYQKKRRRRAPVWPDK